VICVSTTFSGDSIRTIEVGPTRIVGVDDILQQVIYGCDVRDGKATYQQRGAMPMSFTHQGPFDSPSFNTKPGLEPQKLGSF